MEDKILKLMMIANQKLALTKVIKCNEFTKKFGIILSEKDALLLLQNRKDCLKREERIEFGEGILNKLIFSFCDSPYIYQDNYVETISRLQEIFYLYKNESLDELTDDELIDFMKKHFDGVCQGSLDYLEETILDKIARYIRSGYYYSNERYGDYDE